MRSFVRPRKYRVLPEVPQIEQQVVEAGERLTCFYCELGRVVDCARDDLEPTDTFDGASAKRYSSAGVYRRRCSPPDGARSSADETGYERTMRSSTTTVAIAVSASSLV
jgi:hypothetical protein